MVFLLTLFLLSFSPLFSTDHSISTSDESVILHFSGSLQEELMPSLRMFIDNPTLDPLPSSLKGICKDPLEGKAPFGIACARFFKNCSEALCPHCGRAIIALQRLYKEEEIDEIREKHVNEFLDVLQKEEPSLDLNSVVSFLLSQDEAKLQRHVEEKEWYKHVLQKLPDTECLATSEVNNIFSRERFRAFIYILHSLKGVWQRKEFSEPSLSAPTFSPETLEQYQDAKRKNKKEDNQHLFEDNQQSFEDVD